MSISLSVHQGLHVKGTGVFDLLLDFSAEDVKALDREYQDARRVVYA